MNPQRGGAVDDATESEPEQESGEEQQQPQSLIGSQKDLADLAKAAGSGFTWGTGAPPSQSEEEPEPTPAPEETSEPEQVEDHLGEQPEETPAETGEEIEQETSEAEEAEVSDHTWPDSAKARVAQETKRKNKYRDERDQVAAQLNAALAENSALQAQLSEIGETRSVSLANPLANVWDEAGIRRFKNKADEYLEWCEDNPQGGEYPYAKDKDGNNVYLDEQGVRNLKRNTQRALRDAVPARERFLTARKMADTKAMEVYPEYQKPESPFYRAAVQLVESFPVLKEVPDIYMWIGHALVGREIAIQRMNGKTEKPSKKILATRGKVAPTIPKARGVAPRIQGSDLAEARKGLEKTRGLSADKQQDAGLRLLEALNIGRGGRAKKIERVES